jgi:hypothetical protein
MEGEAGGSGLSGLEERDWQQEPLLAELEAKQSLRSAPGGVVADANGTCSRDLLS